MIDLIKAFYIIFGVLTLLAGIFGFVGARSWPSLVGGALCGLALAAAGALLFAGKINAGLILGMLASAIMAGTFVPKVMLNRAPIQAITMALLSVTGVVLTLMAFSKK